MKLRVLIFEDIHLQNVLVLLLFSMKRSYLLTAKINLVVNIYTAYIQVSVFGDILVRIFPHSD